MLSLFCFPKLLCVVTGSTSDMSTVQGYAPDSAGGHAGAWCLLSQSPGSAPRVQCRVLPRAMVSPSCPCLDCDPFQELMGVPHSPPHVGLSCLLLSPGPAVLAGSWLQGQWCPDHCVGVGDGRVGVRWASSCPVMISPLQLVSCRVRLHACADSYPPIFAFVSHSCLKHYGMFVKW